MNTADRELARHWIDWSTDTGKHVVQTAQLRAQGIGDADMGVLLWFAFMSGWHAQRFSNVHMALSAAQDDDKLRRIINTAIDVLREGVK